MVWHGTGKVWYGVGMVGMVWQCNAMLCNIIYCMPYNSYNFDLPPAQYQQINDFPFNLPFQNGAVAVGGVVVVIVASCHC